MCALRLKRLKITHLADTIEIIKPSQRVQMSPRLADFGHNFTENISIWRWKTPVIRELLKLGNIDKRERHEGKHGGL